MAQMSKSAKNAYMDAKMGKITPKMFEKVMNPPSLFAYYYTLP